MNIIFKMKSDKVAKNMKEHVLIKDHCMKFDEGKKNRQFCNFRKSYVEKLRKKTGLTIQQLILET